VVGSVIEQGSIVGAVSHHSNKDADGDGEQNIVDVMNLEGKVESARPVRYYRNAGILI